MRHDARYRTRFIGEGHDGGRQQEGILRGSVTGIHDPIPVRGYIQRQEQTLQKQQKAIRELPRSSQLQTFKHWAHFRESDTRIRHLFIVPSDGVLQPVPVSVVVARFQSTCDA